MQGSMSSGMAGAKKSSLSFFMLCFMLTFLGLLVPRKVGGYKLFTKKKLFFALFHVDVPGVFGAKRGN